MHEAHVQAFSPKCLSLAVLYYTAGDKRWGEKACMGTRHAGWYHIGLQDYMH